MLRPPGGQDETSLIANCTKCNRCRSICPENVIITASLEDGLVNVRTPTLDFKRGYCTFCGKCVEVCPTGALVPYGPNVKIGVARIDKDECVTYSQSGCQRCAEYCPEGALTIDSNGHPVVDESACNGCGWCEYVCPSASFGTYSGSKRRGVNVEVSEEARNA